MERPSSLNDYMQETGLPFKEALGEWEIVLLAYQNYVKGERDARTTISLPDMRDDTNL